MNAMDIGAIQWDAETATPPVLETLTAAGIRTGRVLVTAEAPAMNPLEGFHDRLSAALFQGGFWMGASALDWESGMDSESFKHKAADAFADHARHRFEWFYGAAVERCESEIERIFLAALISVLSDVDFYHCWFHGRCSDVPALDNALDRIESFPRFYSSIVGTQVRIADYRVDFLLIMRGESGARAGVVIECDGHDYHERTPKQAARDRRRDRQLQALGYRVMRFTGSEICRDPFACADEVWKVWMEFQESEIAIQDPSWAKRKSAPDGEL